MRRLLLVLLGALPAGCAHGAPAAPPPPVPVTVAPLRFERIGTRLELSGSLAAVQSVNVGAISGGRVTGIGVRVGDAVQAGQVPAQIDTAAPTAALAQARASAQAAAAIRVRVREPRRSPGIPSRARRGGAGAQRSARDACPAHRSCRRRR